MATGWGFYDPDTGTGTTDEWGMCCIVCMSETFADEYPELARRIIIAHGLAVEYLYSHPYNAGMMFAEGFGTTPEVGLSTVYMKTVAEGRTITWQFSEQNLKNYEQNYYDYDIPAEETPDIDNIQKFISGDLLEESGLGDFNEFIANEIDSLFPLNDTYDEWLEKAKTIDGITD